MVTLERCRPADVTALTAFLGDVDLTLSGLDAPSVRLWIERDASGTITGSTGYEVSGDGRHALIRSVAVDPTRRARGRGTRLARFALERAADEGATTAWLFTHPVPAAPVTPPTRPVRTARPERPPPAPHPADHTPQTAPTANALDTAPAGRPEVLEIAM